MKNKRMKTLFLLILSLALIQISVVKAEGKSKTIVVERNFTNDDKFTLEVRVKDGGYLIDGKTMIKKGIVAYECPLETWKTFEIYSHYNYKLKDIYYEQPETGIKKSLLSEMKNNSITIQSLSTKVIVTVDFAREDGVENSPHKVDTGDNQNVRLWVMSLLVSFMCMLLLYKKRKQK